MKPVMVVEVQCTSIWPHTLIAYNLNHIQATRFLFSDPLEKRLNITMELNRPHGIIWYDFAKKIYRNIFLEQKNVTFC